MGIPNSTRSLFLAAAGQAAGGGYEIERSLRFNSADSAYLSRTPSSAGNRTTWTWSGWVKRTVTGEFHELFGAAEPSGNQDYFALRFKDDDTLEAFDRVSPTLIGKLTTNAVYRDPSAWYHILYVWDTNNGTAADRRRLYVNGVRITALAVNDIPASGSQSRINSAIPHTIGRYNPTDALYLNG